MNMNIRDDFVDQWNKKIRSGLNSFLPKVHVCMGIFIGVRGGFQTTSPLGPDKTITFSRIPCKSHGYTCYMAANNTVMLV